MAGPSPLDALEGRLAAADRENAEEEEREGGDRAHLSAATMDEWVAAVAYVAELGVGVGVNADAGNSCGGGDDDHADSSHLVVAARLASALARHAPHDAELASAAVAAGAVPPLLRLIASAAQPPASDVAAAAQHNVNTERDLASAVDAASALATTPHGRALVMSDLPSVAIAAGVYTGPRRAAMQEGVLRLAAVVLRDGGEGADLDGMAAAAAATAALAVTALRPAGGAWGGLGAKGWGPTEAVAAAAAAALERVACAPSLRAVALRGIDPAAAGLVAAVAAYPAVDAVVRPALTVLGVLTGAGAGTPVGLPMPPPPGLLLALLGVLEGEAIPPSILTSALSLACAVDVVALLPVAGRPPLIGRGGVAMTASSPPSPIGSTACSGGRMRGSDALSGDNFDAWLQCILRPCGVDADAWDLRPVEPSARFLRALVHWVRVADVAATPPEVATAACHTVHVVATASETMRTALLDVGGRGALLGLLSRAAAVVPPPPSSLVEAGLAALAAVGIARRLFFFSSPSKAGEEEGSVGCVLASAVSCVPPSPRLYRLALAAIGSAVVLPPSTDATAADAAAALRVAVAALASPDDGVVNAALDTLAGLVGVTPVADASVADAIGLLLARPGLHPSLAKLASDILGVVRSTDPKGSGACVGSGTSPPPCAPRACHPSPPGRGASRHLRALRLGGVPRKRVSFGSDSFHGP
ncbi:hypothetical protein MMPV_000907 [Pyropia vietnamensis]